MVAGIFNRKTPNPSLLMQPEMDGKRKVVLWNSLVFFIEFAVVWSILRDDFYVILANIHRPLAFVGRIATSLGLML